MERCADDGRVLLRIAVAMLIALFAAIGAAGCGSGSAPEQPLQ